MIDDTGRTPFEALSRAGRTRRLAALARTALSAYDVPVARLTAMAKGFNTTFRVDGADGRRYVLRVQRPGGPSPEMVRSEALWLRALRRDTALAVPEPVPTRTGDLLTVAEHAEVPAARSCVLYHWVDGRFLDTALTTAHLRRVGAFTAHLHLHSAGWTAPAGFTRGRVDAVTEPGRRTAAPPQEEAEQAARLVERVHSAAGAEIVRTVTDRVRRVRDALGRGPGAYGLIHGDLHQENYLFHRGEVRAIDFDDCGYGHFVYDLAVTAGELAHLPHAADLRAALLAGYRAVRPLPASHEDAIGDFTALRRLQLTLWVLEERAQPMFRDDWRERVARGLESAARAL
ncbi:phosphotransferase [Microbispora sp. NPDC088329]|uniref:phosphotransferase enzyme family protein n=1 Tax=Microbispora sp. NPDC088329 TaxID=3154869 RepID=UPI0034390754